VDKKAAQPASADDIAIFGPVDVFLANPGLLPESQQGGEGGIELYFANRASLVITRYNQTVNNLIISAPLDSVPRRDGNPDPYGYCVTFPTFCGYGAYQVQYQYLNLGALRNQGWELQGSLNTGPLTTRGTYSWTKSRVLGVLPEFRSRFSAFSYPQYQPGTSFTYLPEHTWALAFTYARPRTTFTVNINGIGNRYIQNDDVSTAASSLSRLTAGRPRIDLPKYWAIGAGYSTIDLRAARTLMSQVEAVLQIDNVGNTYHNDIDVGLTVLGRQIKAGVRLRL
jgi:hypothetical protein